MLNKALKVDHGEIGAFLAPLQKIQVERTIAPKITPQVIQHDRGGNLS